jgi:hypothetical protein
VEEQRRTQDHPEWDLLPSEYFRRQIYASFWFEEDGVGKALELYPDNILFETDYPHPTCQAPGPASAGTHPRLYAEKALAGIPEVVVGKVLEHSARRPARLSSAAGKGARHSAQRLYRLADPQPLGKVLEHSARRLYRLA